MNGDRSDIGRPTDPRSVLKAQYRMALKMLEHAIDKCPESLWLSAEGHGAAYWRLTFHTLFFTHFYLQKDQHSMVRWPKHRGQLQDPDCPLGSFVPYTKAEMTEYLEFCRSMLDGCIDAMDLSSPDCGFPWYKEGKLEHQINNIRHIQHHTAQLADRLRSATGTGPDWR